MSKQGMRKKEFLLSPGCVVNVYSDQQRVILQLRRKVESDVDLLQPSFKVALDLSPEGAAAIGLELLQVALAGVRGVGE